MTEQEVLQIIEEAKRDQWIYLDLSDKGLKPSIRPHLATHSFCRDIPLLHLGRIPYKQREGLPVNTHTANSLA